jgi:HEAT repeat protein
MQTARKINMYEFNGYLAALANGDPQFRRQAASGLARYSSAEWGASSEALAAASVAFEGMALGSAVSDKAFRAEATKVLGNIGSHVANAVPRLLQLLRHDPDVTVRTEAARALGKIGPAAERAAAALAAVLSDRDGDDVLRGAAAQALALVAPAASATATALLAGTEDESGLVAIRAAAALWAATRDVRAVVALAARLRDPVARDGAVQALYRIGPPAKGAVSTLESVAGDKDRLFREAVVMALGKIAPVATRTGTV